MIEHLLKESYPSYWDFDRGIVSLSVTHHVQSFVLSDMKACRSCHQSRPERSRCNEEVLKVELNGEDVAVVDFEMYAGQFDNTPLAIKSRCDYLLADGDIGSHVKIAFCDLTCSDSKYVEPNNGRYVLGKRAKAREQMKSSINALLRVPLVAHYILTFPKKVGLFGWRDYENCGMLNSSIHRSARESMSVFMKTPTSQANLLQSTVEIMDHDFHFVQVKYPMSYEW